MTHHPLDDPGTMPRTAHSLHAGAGPAAGPLSGHVRADIAVIGGGITGLSAALHAAGQGRSVVVLEANEVGWGASGRSFGQVVPYLRHDSDHVLATFGGERGERIIAAAAAGPDLVFGLIERHAISCEATRNGLLIAAHTPAAWRSLQERARSWQRRNADVALLGAAEAKAAIGGGRYWGAMLDRRGGTINSLAYAQGLADAAMAAGASLYTGSRVTARTRRDSAWLLTTSGGAVVAETVLVCTSAYSDTLWPGLSESVVPVRGYQFLSAPLPDAIWAGILPGDQALTDTRRLMSGVRKIRGNRLQVSGGVGFSGPEAPQDLTAATRRVRTTFPQIEALAWDAAWSGWIAMSPDEYPRLVSLAPSAMAAIGYSGRGLALATVLGRDLARWACGVGADELTMPVTPLRPIRLRAAVSHAARGLGLLYRTRDAFDARRYGRGPWPDACERADPKHH